MKKLNGLYKNILILCFIFSISLAKDKDIEDISKTLGYLIKKEIDNTNIEIDTKKVIEGITEAQENTKNSPLTKDEYQKLILKIIEKRKSEIATNNLIKATSFLEKNASEKDIVQLIKKKLQYQILKEGFGDNILDFYSPFLRIKSYLLDGSTIISNQSQIVDLNDLDQGLKEAIIGMKENEIRKIFVHPELISPDEKIPPNSLLIYEVEIITADKKKLNLLENELAETPSKIR